MGTTPPPGNRPDPTRDSLLRPLVELLRAADADIDRLYRDRGITAVRPRFSMALIRLHHLGPMPIKQLAAEVRVTHSAMSQTVAGMARAGLVATEPGADARTRVVHLTADGAALVPFLEAEWRATEGVWRELDRDLPYPLTRVVDDLRRALATRGFADRLRERLAAEETGDAGA